MRSAAKGNGRNAGHAAPVKTLIKYAHDFIAYCARLTSIDFAFLLTALVLMLHALMVVLHGVFQ